MFYMPKTQKSRCTICLGRVKNRVKLPCKHKFCHDCIIKNQKYSHKCPNCRQMYSHFSHKKKKVYLPISEEFKNYVATLVSRYITDVFYRYTIDALYLNNFTNKLNIIETTINILLKSDELSPIDILDDIKNHINYIKSINT